MADDKAGIIQVLKHAVGLEKGALDVVKLARWTGLFIIVSSLVLALWLLIDPTVGFAGVGPSFDGRIRGFWGALITPAWTGVAIIVLAELVDRMRSSQK